MLSLLPLKWLYGIGAAIAALAATWFAARKSAKSDAKIKTLKDEVKAHEIRNEVDNRVAAERDARNKLHSDWGR